MRSINCLTVNYLAYSYVALLDILPFSVRCSRFLIKITGMLEPVQTVTGRQAEVHPGPNTSPSQDTNSHTSQHDVCVFSRLFLLTPPTKHRVYTNASKCLQKFWLSTQNLGKKT